MKNTNKKIITTNECEHAKKEKRKKKANKNGSEHRKRNKTFHLTRSDRRTLEKAKRYDAKP